MSAREYQHSPKVLASLAAVLVSLRVARHGDFPALVHWVQGDEAGEFPGAFSL